MSFFSLSQNTHAFSSNYFNQKRETRTADPYSKPYNGLPQRIFSPLKINPCLYQQKQSEGKENLVRGNKFSNNNPIYPQIYKQNFSSCSSQKSTFLSQKFLNSQISFPSIYSPDTQAPSKILKNDKINFEEAKSKIMKYVNKEFDNFKKEIKSSEILEKEECDEMIAKIGDDLKTKLEPFFEIFSNEAIEINKEIKNFKSLIGTAHINLKFVKAKKLLNNKLIRIKEDMILNEDKYKKIETELKEIMANSNQKSKKKKSKKSTDKG